MEKEYKKGIVLGLDGRPLDPNQLSDIPRPVQVQFSLIIKDLEKQGYQARPDWAPGELCRQRVSFSLTRDQFEGHQFEEAVKEAQDNFLVSCLELQVNIESPFTNDAAVGPAQ